MCVLVLMPTVYRIADLAVINAGFAVCRRLLRRICPRAQALSSLGRRSDWADWAHRARWALARDKGGEVPWMDGDCRGSLKTETPALSQQAIPTVPSLANQGRRLKREKSGLRFSAYARRPSSPSSLW